MGPYAQLDFKPRLTSIQKSVRNFENEFTLKFGNLYTVLKKQIAN